MSTRHSPTASKSSSTTFTGRLTKRGLDEPCDSYDSLRRSAKFRTKYEIALCGVIQFQKFLCRASLLFKRFVGVAARAPSINVRSS